MSLPKKIHYNSPVILTYAAFCFITLAIGYITKGASTFYLFSVYKSSFSDPLAYIRVFSHVLGHANFSHYFGNMLLLLIIGPMLEEKYGPKILMIMIAVTALVTGLLNITFFNSALLGASGIVFMLIVLSSFVNVQKGSIPLTLILVIFIYIGREIYNGFIMDDNISNLTHIAGGLCGAVLGFIINNTAPSVKE